MRVELIVVQSSASRVGLITVFTAIIWKIFNWKRALCCNEIKMKPRLHRSAILDTNYRVESMREDRVQRYQRSRGGLNHHIVLMVSLGKRRYEDRDLRKLNSYSYWR